MFHATDRALKYFLINHHRIIPIRAMSASAKQVKVDLNLLTLVGREENLPMTGVYHAFKGIPYAEQPINDRRFRPLQPLSERIPRKLDCSHERDCALHVDAISKKIYGSEAGMHMNVYSPNVKATGEKFPVLLYLHGGAFIFGSGNSDQHSPEYLVRENVVVVTFNYRLGPFGFLYLPDGGIEGNLALKDQQMAMKWVRKNIAAFNGDPDNVTLFSQSAGSVSAHLHLMNAESRKYFHKAILMSGCATMDWVLMHDAEEKTRSLARMMGCKGKDDKEIGDFLRTVDGKSMATICHKNITEQEKRRGLPITYKPTIERASETAFLSRGIIENLTTSDLFDIPVILGLTNADGMNFISNGLKKLAEWNSEPGRCIPRSLNVDGDTDNEASRAAADEIKRFYFGEDRAINTHKANEFIALQTDYHFNVPAQSAAELHSRFQHHSPLYFYRFCFEGKLNYWKKLFKLPFKGANHCDDIYGYLFAVRDNMPEDVLEDPPSGQMRRKMCRLWTNFAKYGDPTPASDDSLPEKWTPVQKIAPDASTFDLDCYDIDSTCRMVRNPDKERIDFWRDLFKKYNGSFLKPKL